MIHKLSDHEIQRGLLAFSPFFLVVSSLVLGFSTGLIAVALILILASIIRSLRNLIPSHQRLAVILIISVSVMLVASMLLHAEVYSVADEIGLFLPLLVMNSLVLSVNEKIFSIQDFKSVINYIFNVGLIILSFFVVFGYLRELLNNVSIFTSPAGCFFLSGFLFATINFFKENKLIFK